MKKMTDINLLSFKDTNILYMDFSNIKEKEVQVIYDKIKEYEKYITSQPEESVNALSNFDNMYFNKEVYQRFIEFLKVNKPFIRRSAIIGLKGLIRLMVNGAVSLTKRNLRLFENAEEAKNYLTN